NNELNNLQQEKIEFINNIINYIDLDLVIKSPIINKYVKLLIIKLKRKDSKINIISYKSNLFMKYDNILLDNLNKNPVKICKFNYNNETLYIKGIFNSCFNLNQNMKLYMIIDKTRIELCNIDKKYHIIENPFQFELKQKRKDIRKISFKLSYNNKEYPLEIQDKLECSTKRNVDFMKKSININ
ncbi:hypothetical protein, partial [Methanosphaera sp. WGK6]|uniref:hypothetical protein n=1 Tax=Methanosphaera sp. WGK6 TaxID=1561964 RepID=UPI00086ECBB7